MAASMDLAGGSFPERAYARDPPITAIPPLSYEAVHEYITQASTISKTLSRAVKHFSDGDLQTLSVNQVSHQHSH